MTNTDRILETFQYSKMLQILDHNHNSNPSPNHNLSGYMFLAI